ncbi:MAG: 2-oxo acid dehydrogenase subunit E2 [Propionicimonas sp.]|nr:2-oxo acid dehydrogenase subunit E2 [Propionicimonas sp.]
MPGYRTERLTKDRLAIGIGQELARRRHFMYALVEADLTEPRRLLREHRERTGERLSLTAYLAVCLARTLAEFPRLNALRSGRRLVLLDEVVIEVLLEHAGQDGPAIGYLPIRSAASKSLRQVTDEIRARQASATAGLDPIAGERWLARIPVALLRPLMARMQRSPRWALRLGVAGVSNVGMGTGVAGWGVSPGAGTIALTLGGITTRLLVVDGRAEPREIANLTVTCDHDVVDGAPAARFTSRLLERLASGDLCRDLS